MKVEPGNPSFLDSLGWAYYQQGKLDRADAPLTEAASKSPTNSVIQDHLGELRFKQQRFADAASAWERSLAGDGDSIDRAAIEKKMRDARSRVGQVARVSVGTSARAVLVLFCCAALVAAAGCGRRSRAALPTGTGTRPS